MDYENDYRPSFTKSEVDPVIKSAGILIILSVAAVFLIWAIAILAAVEPLGASQTRSNLKGDNGVVLQKEAL